MRVNDSMADAPTQDLSTAVAKPAPKQRALTKLVHEYLARWVRPGDLVIDATMGNGHDTLFLASIVGACGRVIGFDIQAAALAQTRQRLASRGLERTVELHQQSHETLLEHLAEQDIGQVAAVVFNLGYLPQGDKTLTTRPQTTCAAISAAWRALRPNGLLSLLVYVGHDGGPEELAAVEARLSSLAKRGGRILRHASHRPASPVLFIVRHPDSSPPGAD